MQVVILAREAGLDLELSDVPVSSLVPAELESGSSAAFLEKLSQFDDSMAQQAQAAADKVLPLLPLPPLQCRPMQCRILCVFAWYLDSDCYLTTRQTQ